MAELQTQAGKILSQVAGYVGTRTIDIGLRSGLIAEIAKHPEGISAKGLAENAGVDLFYAHVWLRAAYAAEFVICDGPLPREDYDPVTRRFTQSDKQIFKLDEHMETLLLDEEHPGYVGGLPGVMLQPEIFELFADNLRSGEHIWWCDCGPGMIQCVSCTGLPFYTRMVPGGFSKIPGLQAKLDAGANVTELACGAGRGLLAMAKTYPRSSFIGVDGDPFSLELARERLGAAGIMNGFELLQSSFEAFHVSEQDMVFINISMHECRDIDKVTENVLNALKPGGIFVISDFPFPESVDQTRSVPGKIMCGIQYFEALIDDQLMPTVGFRELLTRHSFQNVGSFDLSGVHAVTYGSK